MNHTNSPRLRVARWFLLLLLLMCLTRADAATWGWDAGAAAGAQDGSGIWGATAPTWWDRAANTVWLDGNTAQIGAGTTTNCAINITNDVAPAGLIFPLNNGGAYTLSGSGGIALSGAVTVAATNNVTLGALIKGSGQLLKTGPGALTLTNNGNAFTNQLTINEGMVVAGTVMNTNTGTSTLGAKQAGRSITVAAGATLSLTLNNVFGGMGQSAASLPMLVVNGLLTTTRFNVLPNLTLNGGTLRNANATDPVTYDGYQFIGTVTVGGIGASTLDTTTGRGNHLLGGGTNTFNVADATGDAGADLVVNTILRDGSGDYLGAGALQKSGVGTLLLTATNS